MFEESICSLKYNVIENNTAPIVIVVKADISLQKI